MSLGDFGTKDTVCVFIHGRKKRQLKDKELKVKKDGQCRMKILNITSGPIMSQGITMMEKR